MPNKTIRIDGVAPEDGGVVTIVLDVSKNTWTATNDATPALFENFKGGYVSGVNVVPGFATKGTGLFIEGRSPIDGDSYEAFLYNYIPGETTSSGKAQMLKIPSHGNWTRK